MCWNQEVSWWTFGIGAASSIFLAQSYKHDRYVIAVAALWFLAVLVQFFEAFVWRFQEKGQEPRMWPTYGLFWLTILQPVLAFIIFYWASQQKELSGAGQWMTFGLVLLYIVVVFVSLRNMFFRPVTQSPHGRHLHLYWWDNGLILSVLYFAVITCSIYFFLKDHYLMILTLILFYGTALMSFLFFKKGETPSLWCWMAALSPLVTLAYLTWRK